MAGSTGFEPATSGLTEHDAPRLAVVAMWRNSLTSLTDRWPDGDVALLDLVGGNGGGLKG
jgi:hypothetical protein